MAEFSLAPRAKQDMRLIGRFTQACWGIEQRNRYIDMLVDTFKKLAHEPILGRPRDELKPGLLSHLCESHVIYFRRVAHGVEVLRILHQRMDLKAHL